MNLTFVINSLAAGGAERVVCSLANTLSEKYSVTIILLASSDDSKYQLSEKVSLVALGQQHASQNVFQAIKGNYNRLFALRLAIKKSQADILLPVMLETNVLTLLAALGLNVPVVAAEHTDPRYLQHTRPWRVLRRFSYPFLDCLVVLNDYMESWFRRIMGKHKIHIIPNPVDMPLNVENASLMAQDASKPMQVLAAGRLVQTKRFDLMIKWFATLAPDYPQWHLSIAGEGELKSELQLLIDELSLSKQVHLLGHVDNVNVLMQSADVFVSTSELEAFPMVIRDALYTELPREDSANNLAYHESLGQARLEGQAN